MSVEAITWALAQRVGRSSAKFVLVAMANCADSDMVCWPSIGYLVEATCQDRKTVIENMKRLRDAGYIVPTNDHKGRTGQVSVYRLNSTKNGTVKESRKRDDPKTVPVPKTDAKSPVFPHEESRFSVERVPKTGHGTVIEPSIEPSGNRHKAREARPSDVPEQVWSDWTELRKAKKAPITATAVQAIRREAEKAGMSLGDALEMACQRGWTGFKADWVKEARAGPTKQSAIEARNAATLKAILSKP